MIVCSGNVAATTKRLRDAWPMRRRRCTAASAGWLMGFVNNKWSTSLQDAHCEHCDGGDMDVVICGRSVNEDDTDVMRGASKLNGDRQTDKQTDRRMDEWSSRKQGGKWQWLRKTGTVDTYGWRNWLGQTGFCSNKGLCCFQIFDENKTFEKLKCSILFKCSNYLHCIQWPKSLLHV